MKNFAEGFALGCGKLLILLLINVISLGCQSAFLNPAGRMVPEAKWIPLSQAGDQSGTWQSKDLSLEYRYDRDHSHLYISGVIHFGDRVLGVYSLIDYFHLDGIAVDAQGKVLDTIALTTAGEINTLYDGPIDFNKILTLPPNAAGLTFSYNGRASGSGSYFDGGYMDFFDYPAY